MSFRSSGMDPAGTALAGNSDPEPATGMPAGMMNEPQPQDSNPGMPSGAMMSGAGGAQQAASMPEGGESGEMPQGQMDASATATATASGSEAETEAFEIPGDWRLILKRKR